MAGPSAKRRKLTEGPAKPETGGALTHLFALLVARQPKDENARDENAAEANDIDDMQHSRKLGFEIPDRQADEIASEINEGEIHA